MTSTASETDPNIAALTRDGWTVISVVGPYITVWRGGEEVLLLWKGGRWQRLGGADASLDLAGEDH